jgi:4-hydroxy-2-oxoheptanedioate aldolase
MTRLNNVIGLLEQGKVAFTPFATAGSTSDAYWAATSPHDGVIFEMEHSPFTPDDLRTSLQYMLNRKQIAESGSVAPAVVPMVRVPVNGRERNSWLIKQVLDIGVYGIVFPMINTADDALHALRAARYIQAKDAPDKEPIGMRGHAPNNAVRYWGVSGEEYYQKADIWPVDPQGEILPILQCETEESVKNLREILRAAPKPGVILISESDLSVSLGRGGGSHPDVDAAVQEAAKICREFKVPFGSPQVDERNIEQRIADGFTMLMPAARDMGTLNRGMKLAGRA